MMRITDKQRIDWLIKQSPEIYLGSDNYAWLDGRPLRRSIDAAIRASSKPAEEKE